MYKFKKSLMALIGLVSLVAITTVIAPHLGYGSSAATAAPTSQAQNVNVVNTPSVNAQQNGTWNVGITGTPVVALAAPNNIVKIGNTDPLPVRDVDNPARQPFEASTGVIINNLNPTGVRDITTVPQGKTLVIEHISIDGRLTNQSLISAWVTWQAQASFGIPHFLTFADRGADSSGQEVFGAGQQVRLYFKEGVTVLVAAERNSTVGQANVSFQLSGYLLDN